MVRIRTHSNRLLSVVPQHEAETPEQTSTYSQFAFMGTISHQTSYSCSSSHISICNGNISDGHTSKSWAVDILYRRLFLPVYLHTPSSTIYLQKIAWHTVQLPSASVTGLLHVLSKNNVLGSTVLLEPVLLLCAHSPRSGYSLIHCLLDRLSHFLEIL